MFEVEKCQMLHPKENHTKSDAACIPEQTNKYYAPNSIFVNLIILDYLFVNMIITAHHEGVKQCY